MRKQKEREDRIYSKLKLEKLPFKLKRENFKTLGNAVSLAFHEIYNNQVKSDQLKWVFSTVKRFKIFLAIFYANEKGEQPISSYVVSIDHIEALTGIDFFPNLPPYQPGFYSLCLFP